MKYYIHKIGVWYGCVVKAISNESTFNRLSYAERFDPQLALKIGR